MIRTNEFYEKYLEELHKFAKVDWVKNHMELSEKPNFWTVIEYGEEAGPDKKSSHEIRYSKMVRWLLDANENHQLGNIFAHKLMKVIGVDYSYSSSKNKEIKVTTEALEDIDIFYKDLSENMCIAIELKQFTKEHKSTGYDSQLDKYEHVVGDFVGKSNNVIKPYYIYLTPLKEDPSNKKWHAVGYEELIQMIEEVSTQYIYHSDVAYKEDTLKIIHDFKEDLQRSMDLLKKDISIIKKSFSKEEQDFTALLANEISHEIESTHFDMLLELNKGDDQTLKDLIMMINDFLRVQNRTPNEPIRLLMRKIYNYLSGDEELDTIKLQRYRAKDTLTSIKKELIDQYNLDFDTMTITGGKGQGISIYHKDNNYRIYLSGDTYGDFPNDFIHLLPVPNPDELRIDAKHVLRRQFNLNDNLIYDDRISYRGGLSISFDQLMEDHVMLAMKELNDSLEELK